jgi:hypothetical protein
MTAMTVAWPVYRRRSPSASPKARANPPTGPSVAGQVDTWDDGAMSDPIPPDALLVDLPRPMPELAHALRDLVRRAQPDAIEAVRPGWRVIGYDVPLGPHRKAFIAWIMAQPEHVHLGFPQGVHLNDPEAILEGQGITKLARWVTVRTFDDIDAGRFESLVREAAAAARIPRAARLAGVVTIR